MPVAVNVDRVSHGIIGEKEARIVFLAEGNDYFTCNGRCCFVITCSRD